MQRDPRSLHAPARPRAGGGDQPDRSRYDRAGGRTFRHFKAVRAGSPLVDAVHLFGSRRNTPASPRSWRFERSAGRRLAVAPGRGSVTTLCRDCGALATSAIRHEQCDARGSPRQIHHAAIYTLLIAHVDCGAFYPTVEKRDRPDRSTGHHRRRRARGRARLLWRGFMACAPRCRCSRRWRLARMRS